jgi:hypothetical protein
VTKAVGLTRERYSVSNPSDQDKVVEASSIESQVRLWILWGNIAVRHEGEAFRARQNAVEINDRHGHVGDEINREFESVLVTVTACANSLEALYGGLLAQAPALARPDGERPDWRKVWRTLDACFDLGSSKVTWPGRLEDLFKIKRNTIVHFKEPSRPLAPHPLGISTSPEYAEYSLEEAKKSVDLLLDILVTCARSQGRSAKIDAYRSDIETYLPALVRDRLEFRG